MQPSSHAIVDLADRAAADTVFLVVSIKLQDLTRHFDLIGGESTELVVAAERIGFPDLAFQTVVTGAQSAELADVVITVERRRKSRRQEGNKGPDAVRSFQ